VIEELDRTHTELLLKTHHIGRIGCHANGRTYVVPVTFAYEDGYIHGHSREGMKVQMMRENPEVCFEVDDIHDFDDWRSVVAWGTFEELSGPDAADTLGLLTSRLASTLARRKQVDPGTIDSDQIVSGLHLGPIKGVTYRIKLQELSGRYERPLH